MYIPFVQCCTGVRVRLKHSRHSWRLSRGSWNSRFLESEQVAFRVPRAISAFTSSPRESSGCSQSSAFAHQWWRGEDCFVGKSFKWIICPSYLHWFEADVLTDLVFRWSASGYTIDSFRLMVYYPSNHSDLWWTEFTLGTLGNLFWTRCNQQQQQQGAK